MRRTGTALIAAASISLLLAGCHTTVIPIGATPKAAATAAPATPKPTASAAPTAAVPVPASIAGFLLEGTPYVPDANGEWDGHYGFWTDASHAVACDIWIFSGDSGGVSCGIRPGHENQRTYALPPGVSTTCDASSSNSSDGTAVAINYKVFGGDSDPNANVGFSGCLTAQGSNPTVDAARKILPPGTTLTVTQTGFETYTCAVAASVASCSDSAPGSSFVFGRSVASFHQG